MWRQSLRRKQIDGVVNRRRQGGLGDMEEAARSTLTSLQRVFRRKYGTDEGRRHNATFAVRRARGQRWKCSGGSDRWA